MNKSKSQKKVVLEGKLTDQELMKITGGEMFLPLEQVSLKEEPPVQALYGISPNPPIYPMYGIKPPICYPMYGVKPPIE